jgi:hypothetical protein
MDVNHTKYTEFVVQDDRRATKSSAVTVLFVSKSEFSIIVSFENNCHLQWRVFTPFSLFNTT